MCWKRQHLRKPCHIPKWSFMLRSRPLWSLLESSCQGLFQACTCRWVDDDCPFFCSSPLYVNKWKKKSLTIKSWKTKFQSYYLAPLFNRVFFLNKNKNWMKKNNLLAQFTCFLYIHDLGFNSIRIDGLFNQISLNVTWLHRLKYNPASQKFFGCQKKKE